LDSLTSPELTFWLHAYSKQFNIGDLSVLIESLDGNITSILDTTGNLQGTQSSPWKEIILDLNAFKADTIRVRFKYTANQASQEQQLAIDDISIDEEPSCPRPKFTKVISTNTTTADLKWSSGGSSHHQVRYKQANTSVWTNVSTNSSNITLTGLQPNTSYRWEVRDSCGANDLSDWVQGPSFFTNCTLFTAPYTNTFSSNSWQGPTPFSPKGSIGNCFTRLETSGYFWTGARSGFDHVAFTGPNSDHTGGSSGYMFARAETSAFDTANIELPMIDLDTLKGPEFSFWWHMYGQAIDRLNVYVRSPGGPETLLGSIVGSQTASANGNWTKETYSLYSFTGDTVIIRMEALKNTGNIFTSLSAVIAIDDIKIDESPNCPPVTASGTVILNGSMVTGVSTGNPVDSVLWNWGDGNFVVADSASYNYPAPGIYQVQQVAYNYCGNSDTITTNLTVCGQVQANISSQSAGTSLAFSATNSVGAGLTYLWYFGDGTTASSTTPNHTYSTPGTYAVSLVVVDVCGTSDSTAQSITVCPNVNLAFNYTNSNTTFSFTASPSNLTNYTWDFGDGNTGTGLSTSHTYANGGNYTVTLTGVDSCGGIWTDSMIISSCPPLAGDFTFNIISSGANGMLVQFLANVSGASGLIWNWGDGTQSSTTATNISHSYPTANLGYIIQLTIINECGDTLEIVRSLNEVSLSELSSEQTTLYPNPARGSIITLEFAHSVNGSYDILDISGTVLHTAPIPSLQSINIPIDGLKSGYYIIRLKDQGSSFQKSFIKID
jgi:PKD repeat protein